MGPNLFVNCWSFPPSVSANSSFEDSSLLSCCTFCFKSAPILQKKLLNAFDTSLQLSNSIVSPLLSLSVSLHIGLSCAQNFLGFPSLSDNLPFMKSILACLHISLPHQLYLDLSWHLRTTNPFCSSVRKMHSNPLTFLFHIFGTFFQDITYLVP